MRLPKVLVFLAIIATCHIQSSRGIIVSFNDVLDVIKVAKDVVVGIAKAWDILDQHVDFSEVPIPLLDRTETKLFGKIEKITAKLNEISGQIDTTGTLTITTILRSLPDRIRLELRLNDLLDYLTRMDVIYGRFGKYVENKKDFERLTLDDFAKYVVSHDSSSVNSLLERIHVFFTPSNLRIVDTGLMQMLVKSLEALPQDLTYGLETLERIWALQLAYADLRGIYALYETFRRFQKQQTAPGRIPSPKRAWLDLAETILYDSKNSVEGSLQRINNINKRDLFNDVRKEVEGDMLCESKQSPQQVLYHLYNAIALTELKGYAMIQFSYMLLRLYNEGNFTTESQIMRKRFEERTDASITVVKSAMQNTSRELWNCDPKKNIKDETYTEITQLLQGYIQNEVDLNPEGTCRENCLEYTYTKSHGCFKNLYCRQQRRCNGKIVNCQFFDSDMWICPADALSGRRYEYVEFENGRVLGRKQGCHRGTTKVDSWWRWLFWHCSYCFCLCDEQSSTSDRYFNMRPMIADITNNKVVTGLRFIKQNRIIHLQIQEGKLLPRGNIDTETVHWVPVEDYKVTDRKIYNGQDYHTLSWEKRAIDLDNLEADEGYIVTGVRFKEIGSHLNFEIYTTKFDFETGSLTNPTSTSKWIDNPNTDSSLTNPRTKVKLSHPDIPIRSPSPSIPNSKSDQYIEFTNTDIDRDAAQTTVPFIDAQRVESLQPVPLSGAGVFHKGRTNFGGFIAPKIITYDFSKHLKAAFPEEEVN